VSLIREVAAVRIPDVFRLEAVGITPIELPLPADGVIGLVTFRGRAVAVDAERRRLAFVPEDEAARLASAKGAVELATVRRRGVFLYIEAELRAGARAARVDMLVDTGAQASWVPPSVLEELGDEHAGERTLARLGRRVGGFDCGEGLLRVGERGEDGGGILGCDVLLSFGRPILFDLDGARIVLLPKGWKP
jgi:hypothetical protein